ncbi:hypothetical protein MRX96_056052 [Rhipicephalus microplus]
MTMHKKGDRAPPGAISQGAPHRRWWRAVHPGPPRQLDAASASLGWPVLDVSPDSRDHRSHCRPVSGAATEGCSGGCRWQL